MPRNRFLAISFVCRSFIPMTSKERNSKMNFKMLTMGAMALAMMTGSALAGGNNGTSALDDPAKMAPFYTDSGMKTMKSDDEFKKVWMAMTEEDRSSMMKDCGDNVIVINAEKVAFTGNKLKDKIYYKHTGYAGGIKEITAGKVLDGRFPERVLEKAVERMIPR
eukprot:gene45786-61996_t